MFKVLFHLVSFPSGRLSYWIDNYISRYLAWLVIWIVVWVIGSMHHYKYQAEPNLSWEKVMVTWTADYVRSPRLYVIIFYDIFSYLKTRHSKEKCCLKQWSVVTMTKAAHGPENSAPMRYLISILKHWLFKVPYPDLIWYLHLNQYIWYLNLWRFEYLTYSFNFWTFVYRHSFCISDILLTLEHVYIWYSFNSRTLVILA